MLQRPGRVVLPTIEAALSTRSLAPLAGEAVDRQRPIRACAKLASTLARVSWLIGGERIRPPRDRSRRRRGSRSAGGSRRRDPSPPAHRRRLLTGVEGAPHTPSGSPDRSST